MPRVIHFELPAGQPERAAKFYEGVFGWQIQKWEGPVDYWLATTGPDDKPGINGAITPRTEGAVICLSLDVPSVDEFLQKIVGAGGGIVVPKTTIPGVGYQAYCSDTEGNVFGIHQEDPSAR